MNSVMDSKITKIEVSSLQLQMKITTLQFIRGTPSTDLLVGFSLPRSSSFSSPKSEFGR